MLDIYMNIYLGCTSQYINWDLLLTLVLLDIFLHSSEVQVKTTQFRNGHQIDHKYTYWCKEGYGMSWWQKLFTSLLIDNTKWKKHLKQHVAYSTNVLIIVQQHIQILQNFDKF